MFNDARKAIGQMPDPAFRAVLFQALALTFVMLVVLGFAASFAIGLIPEFEWLWLNDLIGWLTGIGLFLGSIWLLVPVSSMFIGVFLDRIADAVEAKHYAADPPAREQPLAETLSMALRFTLIMIVANILVLPLYLLPIANLAIFYGLNGYLLGREYFEMVAMRHLPSADVRAFRKANSMRVTLAGVVIALPLVIPLVNLIVPLFGAAFMVHVFKRLSAGAARA